MPLLEVEGLTKRFGGLTALSGVSFTAGAGEIVGIIGPNGAGKTTLFHLITGFHRPTAGAIRFEGRGLTGLRPHAVCRLGIARTFQIAQPFPGLTVLANTMIGAFNRIGPPAAAREAALAALAVVDLAARAGDEARILSLAERRRLDVARALATRPRVLLLDEAMAGLSALELARMIALCRRLRADGLTVLVIEHVLRAVLTLSDRLIVLDHGEKIAEGEPDVVARDPRVVEAYLGARRD